MICSGHLFEKSIYNNIFKKRSEWYVYKERGLLTILPSIGQVRKTG